MNEAIKYFQRKLDDANDLTGIAYIHKLIQLEHQPTIDKTLDGLKNVQYPRHFPNHLVVQLARLNRDDINENLIRYFKMHFTATNTEWHAIGALQDDRVVETVVDAINEYEKTYFSRKVVNRCIHLLGRIGSHSAYIALRDIIETYFQNDNRFLDNYEMPLANEAIDALKRFNLPEAQTYLALAEQIYQTRIEDELATYPDRLERERTEIGIKLHEGSALGRMKHYAFPALIDWHRHHPSQQVRDFALQTLLDNLAVHAKLQDSRTEQAIEYLLSCYGELKQRDQLAHTLTIVEHCNTRNVIPFAWRVFNEGIAINQALNVLARHQASSVFEGILHRLETQENIHLATRNNITTIKAYINYFGQIETIDAEEVLVDLYHQGLRHLQMSIAEALLYHAKIRETALRFLNTIIESNPDMYIVKQTIYLLPQTGERSLLSLLSLIDSRDQRTLYAAEALGLLRNPVAIPHLMQLLLEAPEDSELTSTVAKALERIGTETGFATLNAWEATPKS